MRKVLVIARREYTAAVRTKTFLVSLLIMPMMMGGSVLVQWALKDFHDTQTKRFAVVDRTPGARLFPVIKRAVTDYNHTRTHDPHTGKQTEPLFEVEQVPLPSDTRPAVNALRERLSEQVRRGELFAFVEIGPDVFRPDGGGERHAVRYQSNRPTHQTFPRLVEAAVTEAVQNARAAEDVLTPSLPACAAGTVGLLGGPAGQSPLCAAAALYPGRTLTPAGLRAIERPVPLASKGLSVRNPVTGEVEDATEQSRFAPFLVPAALMMLMFMVIMMVATPLMQSVVEEKLQRIAEVLLGSVTPFQLMLGKLLGMTGVSLTVTAVYLGGAYWAAHRYGVAEFVPTSLLAWFVVFQALAALMYGSLFAAIGAACTDMKETQNLLWPVMLLACLPLFVLGNVLQEPGSAVATGLSFLPFATPMLMIARQAVPPGVPGWQPPLGVAVVLATTLLCVYAAGRIFRVGLLMQGKGARLGEMVRWVFRG